MLDRSLISLDSLSNYFKDDYIIGWSVPAPFYIQLLREMPGVYDIKNEMKIVGELFKLDKEAFNQQKIRAATNYKEYYTRTSKDYRDRIKNIWAEIEKEYEARIESLHSKILLDI